MGYLIKLKKKFPLQKRVITRRVLTFYDLIEAIQEQVAPKDDKLVAEIVIDSLKSGRVKFLNESKIEKTNLLLDN